MRSLPPFTGLGIGFAGEFSREVWQFTSAVAEKGAVVPGSDQARGVIASFVRRAFGRTPLRGVARIRQAALAAILGGATRAVVNWRRDIAAAPGAETGPLHTRPALELCGFYTRGRDGTRNAARRPGSRGHPEGCGFEKQG